MRTYGNAILNYYDASVKWFPAQQTDKPDRVTIKSEVTPKGESRPVAIIYSLRNNNGWKVYDMNISGVSLVTSYRGSYATEIKKNGLDALLAKLEEQAK